MTDGKGRKKSLYSVFGPAIIRFAALPSWGHVRLEPCELFATTPAASLELKVENNMDSTITQTLCHPAALGLVHVTE